MFPHQLGVEKSGIRKGLSTPGSSFCCITSKQNTCPFDNLNVGQIYPQFCPPPFPANSTHTWSVAFVKNMQQCLILLPQKEHTEV